MASVEQLLVRIDATTEQLRREIGRAEKSVAGFDRNVQRATRGTERAFATMGRQVLVTVASFEAVRRASAAFVSMSDTAQVLASRIRLVTDSQEEYNRVQQGTFDLAQRTRIGLTETIELYARIARATQDAGLSTKELLDVTETINQAVKASGASTSEASAALTQLSQGLASGALRGEELNSVLEQTPRLARAIADGTGIAFGKLREVASEGGLTTARIIAALQKEAAAIEAEFAQLPRTVGDAMTQVGNALQDAIGKTNEMSGATNQLVDALDEVRKIIGTDEFRLGLEFLSSIGGEIAKNLSGAVAQLGNLVMLVRDPSLANAQAVLDNLGRPLANVIQLGERLADRAMAPGIESLREAAEAQERLARLQAEGAPGAQIRWAQEEATRLTGLRDAYLALLDPLGGVEQGLTEIAETAKRAKKPQEELSKETQKVIDALTFELDQLKRTDREQAIYNQLKKAGVEATSAAGKQVAALAVQLFDEKEIREELNAAIEAEKELLEEAAEITRDVETEMETFTRTQANLNKLFEAGYISLETYNRAVRDADPAYQKAQEAAKKLQKEQERLREEYEKLALEPFKNALESVQRTFADTFEDIFSGGIRTFGDLADSIKRIMIRMAAEIATLQFFGPQGLNITGMLGGAGGVANAAGTASGGFSILNMLSNASSIGNLFAGGGLANIGSNWAAGGLSGVLLGVPATATAIGGGATAASLGVSAVAGGLGNAGVVTGAATSGLFGSAGALGAMGYAGLAIGAVLLASQLFKKKPSDFTASFQGMLDGDLRASEDKANDQTRQMRDQIQTATESALEAVLGGLGLDKPGGTYLDVAAGSRDGLRFWLYDTMDSYFGQPANVRSDPIASGQFDNVEDLIAGVLSAVIERAGTEGLTTALRAVAENADFSDLEGALADIDLAKFYDGLGQTAKLTAEADEAINEINARFDELTEFAERFGLAVDKVDIGRADAFADLATGFTAGLRDQILALTDPAQLAVRELEAWRDAQIRNAKAIAEANGMAGASTEDLALIMELYGLRMEQIAGDVGDALNYITAAQASVFNEQIRAVQTYLSEVERNNAAWKRLGDQLRSTRQGLLLDTNLSPLSSSDRLAEASRQFEDIAARARLGDQEAIAELPDLSRQYLEASRAYYASSEAYFADFQRVQQVLADTEALTGRHLSIGDQQLAAARDQVENLTALINGDQMIVSSIEQANTILSGILSQLQAAGVPGAGGAGAGTGTLGTGISYVDTGYVRSADDVINGLTRTELDRVRASLGITTAGGGLLRAQIAEDPAFAQRYREAILAAGGVPSFASGGWHSGGLARVHNDELIYTGPPARIFNAAESQRMIGGGGTANDNGDVVSAIRDGNRLAATGMASLAKQMAALTEEMREVKQELGDRRATQPKKGYAA